MDTDVVNIHSMEYCSAIKGHEMTPSAATRMDLDTVMLSKSEEYKHHDITYMWDLYVES